MRLNKYKKLVNYQNIIISIYYSISFHSDEGSKFKTSFISLCNFSSSLYLNFYFLLRTNCSTPFLSHCWTSLSILKLHEIWKIRIKFFWTSYLRLKQRRKIVIRKTKFYRKRIPLNLSKIWFKIMPQNRENKSSCRFSSRHRVCQKF